MLCLFKIFDFGTFYILFFFFLGISFSSFFLSNLRNLIMGFHVDSVVNQLRSLIDHIELMITGFSERVTC